MVTPVPFATVPRLFPDETIAILASGPSLTPEQVAAVRGHARMLAIKDSIRLAPDADVHYGCDAKYWRYYGPKLAFTGPRYALEREAAPWAGVLRNTGDVGLELQPDGLRTGRNSGYQAINLAVHLGARRIILLGFDMQSAGGRWHWFGGQHPYGSSEPPYQTFRERFETLVEPLKVAGVEVINCTPGSALDAFPRMTLADALAQQEALA
jgi:hypothetical protein